jgi:hypothetical protein
VSCGWPVLRCTFNLHIRAPRASIIFSDLIVAPRVRMCLWSTIGSAPPAVEEYTLMGQVVSLQQHQATRKMQIREAEAEARQALQKASRAYRRLHELKGE